MSEDPRRILMENRSRTPTIEELTDQVNRLATILSDKAANDLRISVIEAALAPLIVSRMFLKTERSLDTNFIVNPLRKALVFYTIELTASRGSTGVDTAQVNLLVDGVSVSSALNSLTLTVTLPSEVEITNTLQKIVMGYIPSGSTVNIASSGTGISTVVQCLEVLL